MASRDPLGVIEDYIGSSEAWIRRNAAIALAALGTDASLRRLIHLATADPSADVRECAERELAQTREATAATLQRLLNAPGASDALGTKVERYVLQNALRLKGWEQQAEKVGPLARLRTAWFVLRSLAGREVGRHSRVATAAVLSGLSALLAALLTIGYLYPDLSPRAVDKFALLFIPVAVVAAAIATPFITIWSGPPGRLNDHRAAAVVDIGSAGLLALLMAAVTGVLVALLPLGMPIGKRLAIVPYVAFAVAVLVAFARAGTILAYGAWDSAGRNFASQALTGAAAGLTAATAMLFLVRSLLRESEDISIVSLALVAEGLFLLSVPISVAASVGWAVIDLGGVRRPAVPLSIARTATGLVLIPVVVLFSQIFGVVGRSQPNDEVFTAPSSRRDPITFAVEQLPYSIKFAVPFVQRVQADLIDNAHTASETSLESAAGSPGNIAIRLLGFRPGPFAGGTFKCEDETVESSLHSDEGPKPAFDKRLAAGCYRIEVSAAGQRQDSMPLFESVRAVLTARSRTARPDAGDASNTSGHLYSLNVVLNADEAQKSSPRAILGADAASMVLPGVSSTYQVNIEQKQGIRVSIHPPSTIVDDIAAASAGDAVLKLLDLDGKPIKLDKMEKADRSERATDRSERVDRLERIDKRSSLEGRLAQGNYNLSIEFPKNARKNAFYTLVWHSTAWLNDSGTWTISELPAVRYFSVSRAQETRATIVNEPEGVDTSITLFQATGTEALGSGDDPPRVTKRLDPGDYRLEIEEFTLSSRGAAQARSVAPADPDEPKVTLTLNPMRPALALDAKSSPSAEPGAHFTGTWSITSYPAERFFVVANETQEISAEYTTKGTEDAILELRRDGTLLATADDPEEIIRSLPPGRYSLRVRPYNRSEAPPTVKTVSGTIRLEFN